MKMCQRKEFKIHLQRGKAENDGRACECGWLLNKKECDNRPAGRIKSQIFEMRKGVNFQYFT